MDRETIIKELKNAPNIAVNGYYFLKIRYGLRDDILALLKEQEEKIKSLEQTIEDICCG